MNEPTRLLATPESELERALLDAGRSYKAPASTRAKTLLALGLTGAATSVAPSAAAASSLTKAALSKVTLAVLVIGAVAVPTWRYLKQGSSKPVVPPPALSTPSIAQTSATSGPTVSAPSLPIHAAELPTASTASSAASTVRPEPRAVSTPPLAAELAALDSARTSLSRSDPNAALSALDAYARKFPHGRLGIEAEVLRIGALAKSGQTAVARKRAETFLRRHPDSVLASRVRSYVGL
jgi:hypothetical protein